MSSSFRSLHQAHVYIIGPQIPDFDLYFYTVGDRSEPNQAAIDLSRDTSFKIGIAKNVDRRLKEFNGHSPMKWMVWSHSRPMISPVAFKFEQALHALNHRWRVQGEWFKPLDPRAFWNNYYKLRELFEENIAVKDHE